jgi:hypothetical protein
MAQNAGRHTYPQPSTSMHALQRRDVNAVEQGEVAVSAAAEAPNFLAAARRVASKSRL